MILSVRFLVSDIDLIEKYAIIMAEGNNGGTWATHYTDSQKDLWRARAQKLIEDLKMELTPAL